MLDEAATLFLNGEPETAILILRGLVNATIGFEQLAIITAKPNIRPTQNVIPKNPSMDNLAAIFAAIRNNLNIVGFEVRIV